MNYIFDCDGTLVDSYGAIVDRIWRAYRLGGLLLEPEDIRREILQTDTITFFDKINKAHGLTEEQFMAFYSQVPENTELIELMLGAKGTLDLLAAAGHQLFVYTHRGENVTDIFARLGIAQYFAEIVHAGYGLKRKPDPEGINYIINKYALNRDETYYVGDRRLDIESGLNAGVKVIFLQTAGAKGTDLAGKGTDLAIDTSGADLVVKNLQGLLQ